MKGLELEGISSSVNPNGVYHDKANRKVPFYYKNINTAPQARLLLSADADGAYNIENFIINVKYYDDAEKAYETSPNGRNKIQKFNFINQEDASNRLFPRVDAKTREVGITPDDIDDNTQKLDGLT